MVFYEQFFTRKLKIKKVFVVQTIIICVYSSHLTKYKNIHKIMILERIILAICR